LGLLNLNIIFRVCKTIIAIGFEQEEHGTENQSRQLLHWVDINEFNIECAGNASTTNGSATIKENSTHMHRDPFRPSSR
jgi:hypothetical protein